VASALASTEAISKVRTEVRTLYAQGDEVRTGEMRIKREIIDVGNR